MELNEFKNKLDNREFWGNNSKEMWDAANKWVEEANEEDNICKWSWDCGLKLDYDGSICSISSRFYPPHKSHIDFGKYSGSISLYVGNNEVLEIGIEANTLDELKNITEAKVKDLISKIETGIKSSVL